LIGFIQGGAVAGAGGGFKELIGEHSFSVRESKSRRARFQAKLRRRQKWLLQRFRFSGSIAVAQTIDLPRLCRTRPALMAGFVFLGLRYSFVFGVQLASRIGAPNRAESTRS
jgi:hypothetical protein